MSRAPRSPHDRFNQSGHTVLYGLLYPIHTFEIMDPQKTPMPPAMLNRSPLSVISMPRMSRMISILYPTPFTIDPMAGVWLHLQVPTERKGRQTGAPPKQLPSRT